jgi:hypothetical protein
MSLLYTDKANNAAIASAEALTSSLVEAVDSEVSKVSLLFLTLPFLLRYQKLSTASISSRSCECACNTSCN